MLDLIIPVYNNLEGLYRTLLSIGAETKQKVYVTIVDDASDINYDEVIPLFQKLFPIRILKLSENMGPGVARQQGIRETNNPYFSFIDCGDTFYSPLTLPIMLEAIEKHPQAMMFSWAHIEENSDGSLDMVNSYHNRIHGKIYNREFINKHNITFSQLSPYANEDIGFNLACRMILKSLYTETALYSNEDAAVVWKWNGPSIVRENDCEFYYKKQHLGLALNSLHAINIAKENNVLEHIIIEEIYSTMIYLYMFYLQTLYVRPQFKDEAYMGCKYYYSKIFREYGIKNPSLFRDYYYKVLLSFLSDEDDPMLQSLVSFDILKFLQELEENTHEGLKN